MFNRKCPTCNKNIIYSSKNSLWKANYYNRSCRSCSAKEVNKKYIWGENKKSLEIRCPNCQKIRKYKNREAARSAERNKSWCRDCKKWIAAQKRSETLKLKFKKGKSTFGKSVGFNSYACLIFNEINRELRWHGQHAENNGEKICCGYFLDYYEPNLNIVIEYDEKYHERPLQKEKDIIRQEEIIKHLKCKFYRIKEGQNWRNILLDFFPKKNNYNPYNLSSTMSKL